VKKRVGCRQCKFYFCLGVVFFFHAPNVGCEFRVTGGRGFLVSGYLEQWVLQPCGPEVVNIFVKLCKVM
jgi:hypothetical protein